MNINDIAPAEDRFTLSWPEIVRGIFQRQEELMAKYREIESLPAAPVSLHHANGQRIIRDFAWRTTEELTESAEAWVKHPDEDTATQHALEELADATHFLVELLIFAGINAEQALTTTPQFRHARQAPDYRPYYWGVVYELGLACNFLRNKAWKQSQVPTDELRFRLAALRAWWALVEVWSKLGYTEHDMYNFYFRKSEVNKFRQRSAY